MKLRAECSRDKPGLIIAEGIQQLANSARAEMPTTSTIKRTLRNRRTAHHPPQPTSLADLHVRGVWATTGDANREPFF